MLEQSDSIDTTTFEQILEMDDDDDRDFSKSIVYDYFQQAQSTFTKMDTSLDKRDFPQLSDLGHFLKGSSATLGLTKLKDSCEKIQHYGKRKDETGTRDESDEELLLGRLRSTIDDAKQEFNEIERLLRRFYRDESS
ncbi:histidine containing phosphotransmitter protein [Lineolata rhizophorae]|uniref:Histidine containing phosphotransmitter protein n=1 Tax=Lineolata rhizophorae TaxID=578093 RepID=A0A6A6P9B6_9PEZI|nr:histidine containing phosphotransmitter protein [Lineolata rhizophorae]